MFTHAQHDEKQGMSPGAQNYAMIKCLPLSFHLYFVYYYYFFTVTGENVLVIGLPLMKKVQDLFFWSDPSLMIMTVIFGMM